MMLLAFSLSAFLGAVAGVLAAPSIARGQPGKKIPTVAHLWHAGNAKEESPYYEALLEGWFLTIYTQLRFWRSPVTRERPGQLAGEFLILYAGVRAIGEIFREPDASLLFGLSRGTFYSSFLVIGGLILFAMSRRKPHCSTEELGS